MRLSALCRVVALFGALVVASPVARADLSPPKDVDARRLMLQGNTHYRLKDFAQAIVKYKEGAKLEDAPVFYYNLAQAYRQLRKYEQAIWFYKQYLNRGDVRPEVAAAVGRFVRDMRKELASQASVDPPTEPGGDGHKGRAGQKAGRAKLAGSTAADKTGNDRTVLVEPAKPGPAWYRDWVGWTIGGAGMASMLAGGVLLVSAGNLQDKSDAENDQILRTEYRNQANSRRTWGTIFTLAGGAAVIGGIVKLAINPSKKRETESNLSVGFTGRGVMLSGRF